VAVLLFAAAALLQVEGNDKPLLAALWPVLTFVLITALARLVVRAVVENAYLLRNLGWARSLRTAAHALLMWLPIASIAVPYFVFTEYLLPKVATNELHQSGLLKYGYGDRHDFRDNLLESIAVKFDDSAFALHVKIEDLQRDIRTQVDLLKNKRLKDRAQAIFDEVMPAELTFSEPNSDVALIGWAVDVSVEEAQSGTNAAFKRLRNAMRDEVGNKAAQAGERFQRFGVKAETQANEVLLLVKGAATDALSAASKDAPLAIWWQLAYLQAWPTRGSWHSLPSCASRASAMSLRASAFTATREPAFRWSRSKAVQSIRPKRRSNARASSTCFLAMRTEPTSSPDAFSVAARRRNSRYRSQCGRRSPGCCMAR
jgi:hypothetical protein